MPKTKKRTASKAKNDYSADIKAAKKIGREAMALGGKLFKEAKAQYDKTDSATKKKIKKAAVIGALGLAGMMETKHLLKKKR